MFIRTETCEELTLKFLAGANSRNERMLADVTRLPEHFVKTVVRELLECLRLSCTGSDGICTALNLMSDPATSRHVRTHHMTEWVGKGEAKFACLPCVMQGRLCIYHHRDGNVFRVLPLPVEIRVNVKPLEALFWRR